ncbi:MAG: nucleotidyltransferase family protein, partial [Caulobacteraceae bacterium]|nr:nucleotidyltransferase family protein [Caulobacteraceae bacterium]
GSDLSYEAEDVWIKLAAKTFKPPFCDTVEVRNQARVHIWFPDHFGEPYEPLTSTDEALTRFVAPTYAVGVRLEADDQISVAAPFGLDDLFSMTIRPNPLRGRSPGFERTVVSARNRWPELTVAGL